MSNLLDQAIAYGTENRGVLAGVSLAVLMIGITQIIGNYHASE